MLSCLFDASPSYFMVYILIASRSKESVSCHAVCSVVMLVREEPLGAVFVVCCCIYVTAIFMFMYFCHVLCIMYMCFGVIILRFVMASTGLMSRRLP